MEDIDFKMFYDETLTKVIRLKFLQTYYEVLFNVSEKFINETDYFCNLEELPEMLKFIVLIAPNFQSSQGSTINVLKQGTEKQLIKTIHITIAEVTPKQNLNYYPIYPQLEESRDKLKFLMKNKTKKSKSFDSFIE